MTANQLIRMFNEDYGFSNDWPKVYKVDYHTYAHCCQYVFNHVIDNIEMFFEWDQIKDGKPFQGANIVGIAIGPNNGLMFKNVELILKGEV